jgi:proteasome accessory factor A
MHIIYFDNTLAPLASYLKAGTTQLVLAMLEADWIDPTWLLDDPLAAASQVSRDLSLAEPLRLVGRGRHASAVEVQRRLAELASEFITTEPVAEAVPGAAEIVACWMETLDLLKRRDLAALSRRVDWALKYLVLDRQIGRRNLSWQSPEIKALDLQYASLDPQDGLFLQLAGAGQVEGMPANEAIDQAAAEPPEDTRAYLRAQLMRRWGGDISDIDWDRVRFRPGSRGHYGSGLWLGMPDPARWGKTESDAVLARCNAVEEVVAIVGEPSFPDRPAIGATVPAWGRRSGPIAANEVW